MQSKQFTFFIALTLLTLVGLTGCKTQPKPKPNQFKSASYKSENEINGIKNTIEQYCALVEGTFVIKGKNQEGEMGDIMIYNILPVFTDVWGERWLYAESAMPNLLEEPLEQVVMKIEKHNVDTFYLYNYRINGRERFSMGWYDRDKLKALSKDDLIMADADCYTVVTKKSKGVYEASDVGFCKIEDGSNDKVYYQTTTTLSYNGMCINSNLYDSNKKISRVAPEACNFFERDLTGKYHKLLFEKKNKQSK